MLWSKIHGMLTSKMPVGLEEVRTAPLFSANVLRATSQAEGSSGGNGVLPQYGLLAGFESIYRRDSPDASEESSSHDLGDDNRLFLNTNAPWSAFVCGSQGSGKSHTLSCMLEAALLRTRHPSRLGPLPCPLAGMVFHYDKFATQPCEVAYLCCTGIPVKILVSPASYERMKRIYSNLPGVPARFKPIVRPMMFEQGQLNASRMMKLMAVESVDGSRPLYMEVIQHLKSSERTTLKIANVLLMFLQTVCRLLRQIATASQEEGGFDFKYFQYRLGMEVFNEVQKAMLDTRLDLLQDFMQPQVNVFAHSQGPTVKPRFSQNREGKKNEREWYNQQHQNRQAAMVRNDIWSFSEGCLTIVVSVDHGPGVAWTCFLLDSQVIIVET